MTLCPKAVLLNAVLLAFTGCRGEQDAKTVISAPSPSDANGVSDPSTSGAPDAGEYGGADAGDNVPLAGEQLTAWFKDAAAWKDLPPAGQVSTKCRLREPVAYGVALKLGWTGCGDGCRELVLPDLIGEGWTGSLSAVREVDRGESAVLAISLYVETRPPWETRLLINLRSGEIKAAMHAISTGVEDPIGQPCTFGMSYSAPVLCADGSESMTATEGLSIDGSWSPGGYGWAPRLPARAEPYTGCWSFSTGLPGKLVMVCPGALWLMPKAGSSETTLLAKPGGTAAASSEILLAWAHLVEKGDQISSIIYTWRPGDNVFSQLPLDGAVCALDVTGDEVMWIRHTGPRGEGRGCHRGFATTRIESGALDDQGQLHANFSSQDLRGVLYGVRRIVGSGNWVAALLPRTGDSGAYDREDWLIARRSQWEMRTIRPRTGKMFAPQYLAFQTGSFYVAEVGFRDELDLLKSLREYDLGRFEQIGEAYAPATESQSAAPPKPKRGSKGDLGR